MGNMAIWFVNTVQRPMFLIFAVLFGIVFGSMIAANDWTKKQECIDKGIKYYKEINRYPYLFDGKNADDVIAESCKNDLKAFAAKKTYAPEQLQAMIQQENYPQQGESTTETIIMDFPECVAVAKQIASEVQPGLPVKTIMDNNIGFINKLWTRDGVVVVTCSAPDGKQILTKASYL